MFAVYDLAAGAPMTIMPRWDERRFLALSAERDVTFRDVAIPANTWVLFSPAGANRDPAVFEAPDRFDIDRVAKEGLTFGRGVKSRDFH